MLAQDVAPLLFTWINHRMQEFCTHLLPTKVYINDSPNLCLVLPSSFVIRLENVILISH